MSTVYIHGMYLICIFTILSIIRLFLSFIGVPALERIFFFVTSSKIFYSPVITSFAFQGKRKMICVCVKSHVRQSGFCLFCFSRQIKNNYSRQSSVFFSSSSSFLHCA